MCFFMICEPSLYLSIPITKQMFSGMTGREMEQLRMTVFRKLFSIDAAHNSDQEIVLQHVSKMYHFFTE